MKYEVEGTNVDPTRHINFFGGEYGFLCNFHDAPVRYDGRKYRNSEAAFASMKTASRKLRLPFTRLTPGKAKARGRKLKLRSDWERIKFRVMSDVVHAKFSQHPDLARLLIATGNAYLEEGNYWNDRIWGTVDGEGRNWLGIILMAERAYQRKLARYGVGG